MVDRNSHVGRIVHPPGWPHAATVRQHWPKTEPPTLSFSMWVDDPGELAAKVAPDEPVTVVTFRRHARHCRRCDRDRVVWAPAGYATRPGDFGACPRCDKWHAPHVVQNTDVRSWSPVALRFGSSPVAWHELNDQSVLEIAAFEAWREQYFRAASAQFLRSMMITSCRRDLGFALAEAAYRDMLPTPEDLRIACDLAEARGVLTPEAIERWTLVELWARCMPLLWSLRGDREV